MLRVAGQWDHQLAGAEQGSEAGGQGHAVASDLLRCRVGGRAGDAGDDLRGV